ncbi:MAG: pyruvate kinase [Patescibacteria group bacterium]|nr:pyruvate kinase [Patescibacteria group bacterium]MDD5164089.1 pyruvate kinase [Patescibacteria group bacterium]MDD5534253.1 pyruvate kinase [Patescibacteria group bacterium]
MNKGRIRIIGTLPPYVDHRGAIIGHPLISGLRFNTIMPIAEDKNSLLLRLVREAKGKKIWLDLKTRQLRITKFSYLPYSFVELSRKIKVNLPAEIYFKDCVSKVVEIIDGNKLILGKRPVRVVGAGEPVNILDPSLEVEGFFTKSDLEYIEAAKAFDIHNYMLSFTEQEKDILEILKADPKARIIAKIESLRGLSFVREVYPKYRRQVRLMAARDDLYINIGREKTKIFDILAEIIRADSRAIVASRILTSLEEKEVVEMADISDLRLMFLMGYRYFLLSDMICFHEDSFKKAMEILNFFEREVANEKK